LSSWIHAQAVFGEHANIERVGNAAALGVALLHRHDFLDVLDVGAQRGELCDAGIPLIEQLLRELLKVGGQVLALCAAEKRREVRL